MSNCARSLTARHRGAGLICIDVGQVLGRLRSTLGHDISDHYLVACASVQFWADLLQNREPGCGLFTTTDEIKKALNCAEREADDAAKALLGGGAPAPAMTDAVTLTYAQLCEHSTPASLSKVLHPPMPECCGYDLADLGVITGDAKRLTEQVGISRPVLIIGIRTGGTYLAPLWKAALTELGVADPQWCTVRPRVAKQTLDGLATIQTWLDRRIAPVVVIVDDQPDTGATMQTVAAVLCAPGVELWFSSVGKLWRSQAGHHAPVRSSAGVISGRRNRRLWECLLPDQHPTFIARLRALSGLPALPDRIQLQFRCPQGEARYGVGRAWLPWNHPQVLRGRRPLVNPRKTPIVVYGPDGRALLHLRFIGEGVFGRSEFRRVQELQPRPAWFIDGYVVSVDIGAARTFRERFHAESPLGRTDLLAQAANMLNVLGRQAIAHTRIGRVMMALDPRWSAMMRAMREHCGPFTEIPEPLSAFLARPVPWLGRTGKAIRSSLRYACGGWHWQVDDRGQLHRFQLEANWGDVSFPELELAAFALENRLSLVDTRRLASLCCLAYSSVRDSLPLAALTIADCTARSVRTLTDGGRIALREDFHQLLMTTSVLADLDVAYGA